MGTFPPTVSPTNTDRPGVYHCQVGSGAAKTMAAPDRMVSRSELAGCLDGAEQAVGFVVDAGGEQQGGRGAGDPVAKAQRPQPLDLDRAVVLMPQPPQK